MEGSSGQTRRGLLPGVSNTSDEETFASVRERKESPFFYEAFVLQFNWRYKLREPKKKRQGFHAYDLRSGKAHGSRAE